jgi:hypothetical protein
MARRLAPPGVAQGQRTVEVRPVAGAASTSAKPDLHAHAAAAAVFGLCDEQRARFERGVEKRRAHFLQHAEGLYIDALDSVSVVERMEALQRIIAVFEPDPRATTDETLIELQVRTVNAVVETLGQEDMPKAQALCLRALIALYPTPSAVEPPAKSESKDKNKKFTPAPKRAPVGRRKSSATSKEPEPIHPAIVERTTDPLLSRVLDHALKAASKDAAWYVQIWALRLVAKLAPWTIIVGLAARKEEPNAESIFSDLAKLVDNECDDRVRFCLIQALFKTQAFAHIQPKLRNQTMISLSDRMLVDPCINIRTLILQELGPMVNTDKYTSQAGDKESLATILCMLNDESPTLSCLAAQTIRNIFPKKDDQFILNQVLEQIRDMKKDTFTRRRLSAAKSILPALKKEIPAEWCPVANDQTEPASANSVDAQTEKSPLERQGNEGRELAVLLLAPLTSPGNKQVIHDTVKLLTDDDHFVRLAAAKVLGQIAPDDPNAVTLIVNAIEGVSAQDKKKQARAQAQQQGTGRNLRGTAQKTSPEQPQEEKERNWIKIMAGVYALQMVVGDGAGRQQLLKEIVRLYPHDVSTVRHAVVAITNATRLEADVKGTDVARWGSDAIRATLPLLKHEAWGAREVALQVIASLAQGYEKEWVEPILECLSDSSWSVRHEAVMTTIKLLQGCSDPEKFRGLIKVAAPARVHGMQLNGQDGLLQCSGEDFVLALDALRVLSEGDDNLRQTLGGMLKSGLHIAPGAVMCPGDVCEGTWLLEQPVSHGVSILLESRLTQSDDIARSCVEVAELKRADSGDIFFKSMRKFTKAAEAEIIPDLLNSNELIDFTSETPNQCQSALAPMPVCTLEDSRLDASAIMHSPDSTRCTLPESSLEENNGQISEVHTAGSEDGTAQANKTVRLSDAGERDRQGDRERDRESLSTDIEGSYTSAQRQNGDTLAETPAGDALAPDTTVARENSGTTRIDAKREICASPASLPLAGLPIVPSPRIPV